VSTRTFPFLGPVALAAGLVFPALVAVPPVRAESLADTVRAGLEKALAEREAAAGQGGEAPAVVVVDEAPNAVIVDSSSTVVRQAAEEAASPTAVDDAIDDVVESAHPAPDEDAAATDAPGDAPAQVELLAPAPLLADPNDAAADSIATDATDPSLDTLEPLTPDDTVPDAEAEEVEEAGEEVLEGITIDAENHRDASLVGRHDSKVAVIQALCRLADVELDWIGPVDEPFGGSFRHRPLPEIFERALRGQNYTMGFRRDDPERVAWLRIVGKSNSAALTTNSKLSPGAFAALGANPLGAAWMNQMRFQEAFNAEDARQRYEIMESVRNDIRENPDNYKVFFDTEASQIAEQLAGNDNAVSTLQELMAREQNNMRRLHIGKIIANVRKIQAKKD
jgi:hypothetical protein